MRLIGLSALLIWVSRPWRQPTLVLAGGGWSGPAGRSLLAPVTRRSRGAPQQAVMPAARDVLLNDTEIQTLITALELRGYTVIPPSNTARTNYRPMRAYQAQTMKPEAKLKHQSQGMRYACFVDCEAGEQPLSDCVIDYGARAECKHALGNKTRDHCRLWLPFDTKAEDVR